MDRTRRLLSREILSASSRSTSAHNPDHAASVGDVLVRGEVDLAAGLLNIPRVDHRAVKSILWNGFVVGPITAVAV